MCIHFEIVFHFPEPNQKRKGSKTFKNEKALKSGTIDFFSSPIWICPAFNMAAWQYRCWVSGHKMASGITAVFKLHSFFLFQCSENGTFKPIFIMPWIDVYHGNFYFKETLRGTMAMQPIYNGTIYTLIWYKMWIVTLLFWLKKCLVLIVSPNCFS